jgi:hypothetical protein
MMGRNEVLYIEYHKIILTAFLISDTDKSVMDVTAISPSQRFSEPAAR